MKRWSIAWIALVGLGCTRPAPPVRGAQVPAPPPQDRSPAQEPAEGSGAPPPEQAPAPAPAAPALVTCMSDEGVESFERSGDAAIGCMGVSDEAGRSCWRIDASGAATPLPPAQWPSSGWQEAAGDGMPAVDVGETQVRALAGLEVKIEEPPEPIGAHPGVPRIVDVCGAGRCRRIELRRPAKPELDNLSFLTVLPDGHTLVAGYGLSKAGSELLEIYDLDRPAAKPLPLPIADKNQCYEVLDELAGSLLVQTTDCANRGGDLLLVSRAGTRLATLGFQASGTPYFHLGGDRWLFKPYPQGLAIWDVAKRQRVAITAANDQMSRSVVVLDGKIIELDGEGKLIRYDAALKPTSLGALPRCPS